MDEKSKEKLRKYTVDELRASYKAGKMSAGRYNELLHAKAQLNLEDAALTGTETIGVPNYAKAIFNQAVLHFQDGWDNVVEAATADPTDRTPVLSDLYNSGKAAWGMFSMLMAPLTAFGEVNGEAARRMALAAGASPGAAYYIGLATDLASGFVPAGKIAQAFGKGVKSSSVIKALDKGLFGGAIKKIQELANKPRQLELGFGSGDVTIALDSVIKPGMTKEAAAQAALEKMQADAGKHTAEMKDFVQRHADAWFALQPAQAELPFKVMGEALQQEGVKLPSLLDKMLQAGQIREGKIVAEASDKLSDVIRKAPQSFPLEVAKLAKDITIEEAKKQIPAMAERMGINLDELKNIVPGGRFDPKNSWYENPKKMFGYLKALENRASEIGPLAKSALEGGDAEKLAFARYMTNLFIDNPDGPIAYSKGLTNMLMHWDPENMAKGDIAAAVTTFAKDMAHYAEQGNSFGKMIAGGQAGAWNPTQVWKSVRELYLNSLLPFSWKAAFLGNSYATGNMVLERAVGAMFSTGGGYTTKEAMYMSKGLAMATGDAVKAFADAYKYIPAGVGRFSHTGHQIPGAIGDIINIPMDTVRGMDEFFKVLITRASHYAVAAREGEQVFGYTGTALGRHIRSRVANPTADMMREAAELAETATFQNQLGGFWGKVQTNLQYGPLVFFFPFIKSGINIGKYAYDRTPGLQLISAQIYKDLAAGGPKADAAVARLVMGQLMGHMYFELAKDGYITGGGPVDPQVRKSWLLTHTPYSAATETGWVPLANVEPANTLPGMIADMVEVIDHLDNVTAEQALASVGFSFMRNFTNGTFWQSANALQDAVQTLGGGTDFTNPSYRFLRSPISAPFTGLAPFARAADPISRQTRSYIDDIRNKIPYTSKDLKPLRDGLGDPIVPPQALGGSWIGLMRPIVPAFRPYETDPVKKELGRLGVKMPLMSDHMGGKLHEGFDITAPRPEDRFGVRLSNDELDMRYQIYRNILRHPEFGIEASILNNPNLNPRTDSMKRYQVEHYLDQAWKNSGEALMVQRPDLARRILESDAKHILALTPDEQKPTVQDAIDAASSDIMDVTDEARENLSKFGIIGAQPDNATYGVPYGPLINIKQVPRQNPGEQR